MSITDSPLVASSPAVVSALDLQISSATNQMGLNFLRNLPASVSRDNVVLSPLSLQIVLNLILLGAKDPSTSRTELAKVLGYETDSFKALLSEDEKKDDNNRRLLAHKALSKVIESITKSIESPTKSQSSGETKEVEFSLANLMLTNSDIAIPSDEFVDNVKKYYANTKIENLLLDKKQDEQALKVHERVNKWVEQATKKQINEILKEKDLPPISDIALILLNVANFKGKWLNQFNESNTSDETFYNFGQENEAKKVKFMHQTGLFSYVDLSSIPASEASLTTSNDADSPAIKAELEHYEWANKLNCRILSMPFSLNEGAELDMLFLLPNKRDGLPELLKQLSSSAQALELIYRELEEAVKLKVRIDLPKFSFESAHEAKSILQTLGLVQIFSDQAQFDLMFKQTNGPGAKVDQLLHKAKISVDESGAQASAATVAVMSTRSMSWPPREPFTADRPFIFLLRHSSTGMLLFAGFINAL